MNFIALFFISIFAICSSQCCGQIQILGKVENGSADIHVDVFTMVDSELSELFQPKPPKKNTFSGTRLLSDESVRKSLGISNRQMEKIQKAQADVTKAFQKKSMQELLEFQKLREQLTEKNVDEDEITQFVAGELNKFHQKAGDKNRKTLQNEVANVLTKEQAADLDSLQQRVLLIQAGLSHYLTNQKVLEQICEDDSRKQFVGAQVNEVSKQYNEELKKLKLKFQKKMVDSLNNGEKETLSDLLDMPLTRLRSEPIGQTMLLKPTEK